MKNPAPSTPGLAPNAKKRKRTDAETPYRRVVTTALLAWAKDQSYWNARRESAVQLEEDDAFRDLLLYDMHMHDEWEDRERMALLERDGLRREHDAWEEWNQIGQAILDQEEDEMYWTCDEGGSSPWGSELGDGAWQARYMSIRARA
ncbi:hypothetical protein J4E86_002604 [Alternaria arbusti]|uniref:uncharacterized protein n=1 Tax=Alternaria arbusti TaxID=232088 RepID=UPI00221EC711|nr:uncharacterized protein J4E86_002604 [Alternaria arbusti]KAI4958884.1 hypothetical protein J4E86_002604 [Alternaria arbusti]